MALQHLRSSTANKRPTPAGMSDGQLALNTNVASPGFFFKDSTGALVKAGPVHVGSTAPNASPAVGGESGNSTGELWLDTSLTPNELKTWNGSAWVSATGQEIPVSKLIDGSARQLLQTDAAGTGVEWTSNVDVPGTLDVTSTATFDSIASHPLGSAAAPTLTFTGDTNTGIYSPGADQVGISTNASERIRIGANGELGLSGANYGTSGQVLTSAGSGAAPTWETAAAGASVTTSDTPPASPSDGDLWYDSVGGRTYVYYDDGDSSQWVDTSPQGSGVSDAISEGDTSAEVIDTGSDGRFVVTTEGSERLRVTSAGLVGIGTTSNYDDSVLEVRKASGGDGVAIRVTNDTTTNGSLAGIIFTNSTGDFTSAAIAHKRNDNALIFFNGQTAGGGGFANATEAMRLDSSNRLLVGTSSTSKDFSAVFQGNSASAAGGANLLLACGASSPADGSAIGYLSFTDSNHNTTAQIQAQRDGGTWTSGTSQPGRLVFSTTTDGASSPTERMRITGQGYFKFSDNATYRGSTASYNEFNQSANNNGLYVRCSAANFSSTNIVADTVRSATSAYWLFLGSSGDGSDLEFRVTGDGNTFCDGSFTGGGADYAEYFEWSDSNPDGQDRRGISVVLDGDRIREAVVGEDPIGVISGNPSVVGDGAWNKWNGKHLRDQFGSYLLDENGDRQLNPDYDPEANYIPREQRPEWDCVGLMGKLRIRKGQVTGSRWIKMRDISDTVEEWLVR